jgi:diphthine synthase
MDARSTLIFSVDYIGVQLLKMGELVVAGLGLFDERSISLRGLEEARNADFVFAELYTSLMPGMRIEALENLVGKKISFVTRKALEEEDGEPIIQAARRGRTVFLVPGDPLIATTHVNLRIRAREAGIQTRIVHGASIITAVIGLSGLQNYKFGKSVTIPFPDTGVVSEAPYDIIGFNRRAELHTLCFLDIQAETERFMTVSEALNLLLTLEKKKGESLLTRSTLLVGVGRAGSPDPVVKAGLLDEVQDYDFGKPPFTLVFPGKLHFMEAEALITLADAPESIRERVR